MKIYILLQSFGSLFNIFCLRFKIVDNFNWIFSRKKKTACRLQTHVLNVDHIEWTIANSYKQTIANTCIPSWNSLSHSLCFFSYFSLLFRVLVQFSLTVSSNNRYMSQLRIYNSSHNQSNREQARKRAWAKSADKLHNICVYTLYNVNELNVCYRRWCTQMVWHLSFNICFFSSSWAVVGRPSTFFFVRSNITHTAQGIT